MLGLERSTRLLALTVLLGGCSAGGDDAELQDETAAEAPIAAVDLSTWEKDGDGLLTGEEWTAYTTDRNPWHVWDANQSGALEQVEFESGAVSGRAAGASFESWDTDGSGGVDGSEWEAAWLALYDENGDGSVSAEEIGGTP